MTTAKKIEQQLKEIPDGTVFQYADLPIERNEFEAAAKAMSRLVSAGKLKRAAKGRFYKPEQSIFGLLPINDEESLKPYLFRNGRRYAYITGMRLYNAMGLTTQMAFTTTLATPSRLKAQVVGKIRIRTVKTYTEVTDDNYIYLGFLDSLKDFNSILDRDVSMAVKVLTSKLRSFSKEQKEELIIYALKYPPRVRAFLGALLENLDSSINLSALKNSYSPLSEFKFYITPKILPTANQWNIK
jgi:hypothetical protein